jgi:hypothetical protein
MKHEGEVLVPYHRGHLPAQVPVLMSINKRTVQRNIHSYPLKQIHVVDNDGSLSSKVMRNDTGKCPSVTF